MRVRCWLLVGVCCLLCDVGAVYRLLCVVCACGWSALLLVACSLCVGCLGALVVRYVLLLLFGSLVSAVSVRSAGRCVLFVVP